MASRPMASTHDKGRLPMPDAPSVSPRRRSSPRQRHVAHTTLGVESKRPKRANRDASDGISPDWSGAFREALRHKECRIPGYAAVGGR